MIARVFARKTSMTPTDEHAFYDFKGDKKEPQRQVLPKPSTPVYDRVLVSCTFTWDIERAKMLAALWKRNSKTPVELGGPAFDDPGENFVPGIFLKKGVTITSRGCPSSCSFCFVPKREKTIRELPITEGNIVQDNNLLGCSRAHIEKVFEMLRTQKNIDFLGGFDCLRFEDWHVWLLRSVKLYQAWFAFDVEAKRKIFKRAIAMARKHFTIRQVRAYVLIGYEGDTIEKAEERLFYAAECGALPMAMRYRNDNGQMAGTYLYKQKEWSMLQHEWTRKEIIFSKIKEKAGVI